MPPEVPAGRRAAFLLALVVAVLLAVLLAGPAAAQRAGEGEPTPGATAWVDQVMGQFATAWEAAVGTAQQVATIERFQAAMKAAGVTVCDSPADIGDNIKKRI